MGISLEWADPEKTIIHITFGEKWHWSDLYEIEILSEKMLETVAHKVSYIVNMHNVRQMPASLSMSRAGKIIELKHPKSDCVVIAGSQPFLKAMLNTVMEVRNERHSPRIFLTSTVEEAHQIVAERQIRMDRVSRDPSSNLRSFAL
jgi:hypothetical protein